MQKLLSVFVSPGSLLAADIRAGSAERQATELDRSLDVGRFGDHQGILYLYIDAEVAHSAFDPGVPEQDPHGTQVANTLVDQ